MKKTASTGEQESPVKKGLALTRRAVVLTAAVCLLLLSYATSVQVYIHQQHEMGQKDQEIRESQIRVAELQSKIRRWEDPAYIKAQARARLGWVVPGEVGYVVLDGSGKPIDAHAQISTQSIEQVQDSKPWYEKLAGSVQAADQPAPATTPAPASAVPTASQSAPQPEPSPTN